MTHYFKAMAGAVNMEGGKVKLLSRGDTLDGSGLADGEFDRLLAQGALATEAEWNAGESTPHHLRTPHRNSLDPRSEREPEKVVDVLAPAMASADVAVTGTAEEIMADTRRGTLTDPETDGEAPDVLAAAAGDGEAGSTLPNLSDLSDDALLGLWEGKPPLVKDLVTAVGDDADLARRVLEAEQASVEGGARSTLEKDLTKVIEADEA